MDFRQTLQAAGLIPLDIPADGMWHRCATTDKPNKRNGSFKLFPDGRTGILQNHATMPDTATWKSDDDTPLPLISQAKFKEAQNEARRHAIQATQDARRFWASCRPLRGGHPYIERKMLSMVGCAELRVDCDGWLVVPVMIDQNIMSLQRIAPDGQKLNWKGASVKGGCYIIQTARAVLTVLCEGFATGLAIHQCMSDCRVVVGFDCGNMLAVARRMAIHGLTVIAADNDHLTEARTGVNPGRKHGMLAAQTIGCGITWPDNIQGTDFADQFCELMALATEANDSAPPREKVREPELRKMVSHEIARKLREVAKFVPHPRIVFDAA